MEKIIPFTKNNLGLKRGDFSVLSSHDIKAFKTMLGEDSISQDPHLLDKHNVDIYKMLTGQSKILLFPKSTNDVSNILKYCNQRKLAITPQGGKTGLVAGAVPVFDEIILCLCRMNQICGFDEHNGLLIAEAGNTLSSLTIFAEKKGYNVPLDLVPDESCQIGGNISTNAGGLRFFQYGSLHSTVQGLEVVLANGDVLDLMNCMKKDNTGYDLKHLMIGSEGTLGIITKVAISCPPATSPVACLFLGFTDFKDVLEVFEKAKHFFRNEIVKLGCCEILDDECITCVEQNLGLKSPIEPRKCKYYLILEIIKAIDLNNNKDYTESINLFNTSIQNYYEKQFIAYESKSFEKIWKLRRGIGMAVLKDGYAFKYDFSIPLALFPNFMKLVRQKLEGSKFIRSCMFGHLGDSNIHLVVTAKHFDIEVASCLEPFVYEYVCNVNGSISAEHGIGFKERKYLKYSKSAVAINLMQSIKRVFDPNGILNPYKIFN